MARAPSPITFSYRADKAFAALVYLAADPKVTLLDKKKASSLLFLADKAYLRRYGRPIFGEEYKAMRLGTVAQRTLDALGAFERAERRTPGIHPLAHRLKIKSVSGHKYPVYESVVPPDLEAFAKLELDALCAVILEHGHKSFAELDPLIHDTAWEKAWARRGARQAAIVRYEDFFEEPGVLEGAREELLEQSRVRRALSAISKA